MTPTAVGPVASWFIGSDGQTSATSEASAIAPTTIAVTTRGMRGR
jgi:hypothetical protein